MAKNFCEKAPLYMFDIVLFVPKRKHVQFSVSVTLKSEWPQLIHSDPVIKGLAE